MASGLYKKDIAYLMSLSKHVGEKVSRDVALELLRAINEINIEKNWYQKNDRRLKSTFKTNYNGQVDMKTVSDVLKTL